MKTWLIDTGPVVAYLDMGDPAHSEVAKRLDGFTGQLATTSAVITEAMHLAAVSRDGPRFLAEFVSTSGMEVYDLCRPPELHEAVSLIEKYADTPMDFADATLILPAERLDVLEIPTLDRRGFTVVAAAPRPARSEDRRGFGACLRAPVHNCGGWRVGHRDGARASTGPIGRCRFVARVELG